MIKHTLSAMDSQKNLIKIDNEPEETALQMYVKAYSDIDDGGMAER